jgi:hypothetical protein
MKYLKLFEEYEVILYPVGTSVVCIDDEDSSGIKKGEVYEIEEIKDFSYNTKQDKEYRLAIGGYSAYKLVGIDNAYYMANRFVDELEYNVKQYNL